MSNASKALLFMNGPTNFAQRFEFVLLRGAKFGVKQVSDDASYWMHFVSRLSQATLKSRTHLDTRPINHCQNHCSTDAEMGCSIFSRSSKVSPELEEVQVSESLSQLMTLLFSKKKRQLKVDGLKDVVRKCFHSKIDLQEQYRPGIMKLIFEAFKKDEDFEIRGLLLRWVGLLCSQEDVSRAAVMIIL